LTLVTGPLGAEPDAGRAFPRIDRGRVDEKGEAADNRERLFALRYWKPESRTESAFEEQPRPARQLRGQAALADVPGQLVADAQVMQGSFGRHGRLSSERRDIIKAAG